MDVLTHKCPNCSGPLLFDAKNQTFHCEYCGSVFTETEIEAFEKKEQPVTENSETTETISQTETTNESSESSTETVDLFLCPSCGAEIVTDSTTAATYCYYCHNPVVLSGRISGKFLPESVLPFAIEKEAAVSQFLAWTKKKRFVPKDFFNQAQIEKLTGVYFPYWMVDAELDGDFDAEANSVSVWRVGDVEYTQTKKFAISRQGRMNFKEFIKNALSKNVTQKMVESVQPFAMDKAVPFKSQYLAGFQAEKRDIEFQEMAANVESELKTYGNNLLQDTISGYTTVYNKRSNITITSQNKHYVLLPVWIVTYRSSEQDKKIYYYAMNGQSGKVSGVLPIAKLKLALFAGGISLIVFLLALWGGYFL